MQHALLLSCCLQQQEEEADGGSSGSRAYSKQQESPRSETVSTTLEQASSILARCERERRVFSFCSAACSGGRQLSPSPSALHILPPAYQNQPGCCCVQTQQPTPATAALLLDSLRVPGAKTVSYANAGLFGGCGMAAALVAWLAGLSLLVVLLAR